MHVNDVEINGFIIDEFNVNKLEVGKTQGVCPLCSHDRKPENRKKKCASYDWERGLGSCHNCNTTFQLHTYKRKGNKNKEYVISKLSTENKELYGSVKPTEISRIIKETDMLNINPSQIQPAEEIKSLGTFKVTLNLHSEIQSQIKIKVIPEEEK